MWHNIRNNLDIKSKKNWFIIVSYTPILLTVSMSGPQPKELILKTYVQKRSVCTLFATVQQPHSRVFINQKILPLDKLINQQEGILAYKVINGTFLLNDFLNHGEVGHQIQLWNNGDLRIPLYTANQSQLFVCYRAINTWNGLSGDSCIYLLHNF